MWGRSGQGNCPAYRAAPRICQCRTGGRNQPVSLPLCQVKQQNKKSAEKLQHEICEFLEAAGKTVTVAAEKAERGHIAPDGCECILVLGGDGTMLNAADDNAEGQIPLLGINLGTMGYLAEIEKDAWKEALTRLLDGNFEIEERMMLMGYVEDCPGRRTRTALQALNDVAITRSGQLRVVPYDVYVNGQFLNRYEADGIILSTPTGSTGYNLSAGGPIAEPQAKLILLTPICPHTLNTRTIILSPEDRIEIEIGKARDGAEVSVEADFDGSDHALSMKSGQRITVQASPMTTKIIRIYRQSFLETLHRKMSAR